MLKNLRRLISVFIVMIIILSGCVLFKPLDKVILDATEGLEKKYNTNIYTLTHDLGKNMTSGALAGIVSDSSKIQIEEALAKILHQFKDSINVIIVESRDSILNGYTEVWMQQRVEDLGESLKVKLGEILDDPVGTKTNLIVTSLISNFTSEETIMKLRNMRDKLLGIEMQRLTDSITKSAVRSAMEEFEVNYDSKFKIKIQETLADFDQLTNKTIINLKSTISSLKSFAWILGFITLILLIIAGYIYLRGKRHEKILGIITQKVDKIPNQPVYDQLVAGIKKEVSEKGLEPQLQSILKKQGLYRQPDWLDKDRQVLNLMSKYLNKAQDSDTRSELLKKIKQESSIIGLEDHLESILGRNEEGVIEK